MKSFRKFVDKIKPNFEKGGKFAYFQHDMSSPDISIDPYAR